MAGRITIDNFSEELIEYMNKMGLTEEQVINIIKGNVTGDLDGLITSNKNSIVEAINELFQDVDSGKTIIADAIDDSSVTKNSTFAAMGEAIEGIHADREEDRQKLIEILQDSNMELTGTESMDTLLDLIDMSNLDLSRIVQVACRGMVLNDSGFAIILYDNGCIYSCGNNVHGELGLGDTNKRSTFTQVTTNINNDVKQIVCGEQHAYIVKKDGSLWATGNNYSNRLGVNTNGGIIKTFTQVTTNINNDVKQVACGDYHTFILKNDGSLWSCGSNGSYSLLGLGDTSTEYYSTFTKVTDDVNDVVCGQFYTIIIKKDGTVWACGDNSKGQLGLGDTNTRTSFTQVTTGVSDAKQISCGNAHTFMLKNDGSLWACGDNSKGQLGLGDTNTRTSFTQVTTGVKYVACGSQFTFIIKNDGSLWACGDNTYTPLGLGATDQKNSFIQVTTINDVKYVSCGKYNAFVIKNDGSLWACGQNGYGQLGLGDNTDRNIFTQVSESDALRSQVQTLNAEITMNKGNLATVLTDEGVELTGDETLADLIVKTDEEFDRLNYRRGAVVECNVSVDGSQGKNNGTRYSDTISTTVTTNFGFIPSIIILYFDTGGRNVVSGDVYPLSGTLEILIDTNVDSNLLYATSVTENSFTLVSRNARDRNDGTGDLYYYQGNVIKIYGIE